MSIMNENNNYQLDREDGIPSEYCAIADVEVSADTKQVEIALKRVIKRKQQIRRQGKWKKEIE